MEFKNLNKRKILIFTLDAIVVLILLYLFVSPFYLEVKYRIFGNKESSVQYESGVEVEMDVVKIKEEAKRMVAGLQPAEFEVSSERLIIKKIGVNIPITDYADSDYGLSLGAWRDPEGSAPNRGGNTIITGHRFKYLPPSNMTFYLLHKLEIGDIFTVLWRDEHYVYKVRETKIVEPTELSILDQTEESIVTLYTCDPIYSQKNRLVVVGELIDENTDSDIY